MSYEKHESFLNDLAKAYTEYNADYILPWLADDFAYCSFWVTAPDLTKEEYSKYIIGKLATMKRTGKDNKLLIMYEQGTGKPFLLCNEKSPQDEYACFTVDIDDNGKVKSLAIMPTYFYRLGYKDKEEFDEFIKNIKKQDKTITPSLSINFGTQENDTAFIYDLRDAPNILVAGGGGVTRFLTYVMLSLLENNTPEQLEIIMIDSVANCNLPWKGFPHITKITDKSQFFSCLTDNATEIQHRLELLLKAKCLDIIEYNKSTEHTLPYRIITIGDLQTLLKLDKELTLRCLDLICKHGQQVGMFLIARQAYDIPQEIIDVFHTKLVFPQVSEESFIRLTKDTTTAPLLIYTQTESVHGKVLLYKNDTLLSKFTIYYLPENKEEEITNKIIKRYTLHQALPINFGTLSDNTDYIYDLRKTNGIIITGHVGSGKEVLLNRIIADLAQNFTQNICQFVLIDPLGHDQEVFNNLPHLIKPIIKLDMDIAANELLLQIQEILHRYDLLIESNCFNIDHYNSQTQNKMPFRVITINQFSELLCINTQTPHWRNIIVNNFQTIVKLGPTVGIYLIISTHPHILKEDLLQIFNTKISFQARDKADSIRILGLPGAENLKPCGEALFYHKNTTPIKITIPYLSDKEISNIVKKLQN